MSHIKGKEKVADVAAVADLSLLTAAREMWNVRMSSLPVLVLSPFLARVDNPKRGGPRILVHLTTCLRETADGSVRRNRGVSF